MMWFIADTHYGHKNIVRGTSGWNDKTGCRDFSSQEDHDTWVVDRINAEVQADDVLYHLGDWSFGGEGNIKELARRLNCKTVHLVLGNHDTPARCHTSGVFASVQPYLELPSHNLVLSHYPIELWNRMDTGSIHLHGHVHGKGRKIAGRYDVGVDALGLCSFNDVVQWPKASRIDRHGRETVGKKPWA